MTNTTQAQEPRAGATAGAVWAGLRIWASAYRVELILFAVSYALLAMFSSQRFLRQSEAPHFVYQAKAWLEGRVDLDPNVLPNLEDWACVREVAGQKVRCEGPVQPTDRWYVSFPSFPAVAMLPFVAVNGYQLNDTSFGVFVASLAVAFFYSLLRLLAKEGESTRSNADNVALAATLAFGSVFFYCAIRGEVWFSAEVMGVLFTSLYARNALRGRRPALAGLFFSMAVLTRTPLVFSGVFFLMEVLCPEPLERLAQLRRSVLLLLGRATPEGADAKVRAGDEAARKELGGKLSGFLAGAGPLALLGAFYNYLRFGSVAEFGHRFLYNNVVNVDIDHWGLFHPYYLPRNLYVALFKLPGADERLVRDPMALSLWLTLPLLALVFVAYQRKQQWPLLLLVPVAGVFLVRSSLFPVVLDDPHAGNPRNSAAYFLGPAMTTMLIVSLGVLLCLGLLVYYAGPKSPSRLHWPLWITVACCALPGLLYQNTGRSQFGFRFSLDYTPYLILLLAVSAWSLKSWLVRAVLVAGGVVNFWGAVAFKGYTELMRRW